MRKNLVLAWVPLLLALGFEHFRVKKSRARLLAMPCTVLWFLYYPNAPYLCTEFLHLYGTPDTEFWIILVLLNGYALMGLTLGYLSLEIFHTYVRQRWGTLPGWVLLAVMALFSGFGIYFGRILRLNSWHLFTRPEKLHIKLSGWLQDVPRDPRSLWFAMAFAGLIFISHCLLRGLASRETLPESRIK